MLVLKARLQKLPLTQYSLSHALWFVCIAVLPCSVSTAFRNQRFSFAHAVIGAYRRKFSSGDLSEYDDEDPSTRKQEVITQQVTNSASSSGIGTSVNSEASSTASNAGVGGGFSLNFARPGSKTTSAPTSPSKTRESFLQRVSSLTGAVRGEITQQKPAYNKDRCFNLLVIDDQNTDWSKYFRGKRIHGDWDIRVEQAEFRELSVTSTSEAGVNVSMAVFRNGTKVIRSFRPDFVLIRQNMKDAADDFRNIILAFKFGGVASINSINAIYNFQDKPWVFSHLLEIRKRLGKDNFPLIEQCYFPNYKEMMSAQKYPCVFKIGHAHGGLGKMRVENNADFQDMASIVAVSNTYCTIEQYIDAKYDIHIQKIGGSYKCFQRKSISGNWKTNIGSAMLEQAAMTERYKIWVDEVCKLFGGLEICAIEAIVDKSGKEHIIEVNDSALTLMGESQEDDRRYIAELVAIRMQASNRPPDLQRGGSRTSIGGISQSSTGASPTEETARLNMTDSNVPGGSPGQQRRDSQASQSSSMSGFSSTSGTRKQQVPDDSSSSTSQPTSNPPPLPPRSGIFGRQTSTSNEADDSEDTMKNLRKTFAGIFGDM